MKINSKRKLKDAFTILMMWLFVIAILYLVIERAKLLQ